MTKRREFGNIRKLPSGRFQARYQDALGKSITAPATFRTKTAAQGWLDGQRVDMDRSDWVDPRLGRQTVADWASVWRNTISGLTPKTVLRYESALACQILPRLGDVPVAEVTIPVVRRFVRDLEHAGLAPTSTKKAKAVLSAILKTALEGGAIRHNPCTDVRVPGGTRRKVTPLTASQVDDIANAMPRDDYALLVRFAAYTGLRAGELGALRLAHFDRFNRQVRVADSLSDVAGHLEFRGTTKTHAVRIVQWPAVIHGELTAHLDRIGPDLNALVFTSPEGTPLRHTNFYRRFYKPAVARAGLPADTAFHDLRHTCASLLLDAGVEMKVVSEVLGHTGIGITMNLYAHLYDRYLTDAANAMDAAVTAARSRSGKDRPNPLRVV